MRRTTIALATAALLWAAAPAWAHVDVIPAQAPAGSTVELEFEVGHGCDGSPVVAVAIRIPQGVTSVTPAEREGWAASVEMVDGFEVVSWEGGPQGADEHGSFFVTATLPNAEGEVLAFPAVQTCEEGEVAWIELPGDDGTEPESPAPLLTLTEGDGTVQPTTTEADSATTTSTEPTEDTSTTVTTVPLATTEPTTVATTAPAPVTTAADATVTDTTVAAAAATDDSGGVGTVVAVVGGVVLVGALGAVMLRRRSAA